MTLSDELKGRICTAFSNIEKKSKANSEKVFSLLHQAHQEAEHLLEDPTKKLNFAEMVHGLSALGKVPDGSKPLPSKPFEIDSVVRKDGTILGTNKWELLDPKWAEALEQWMIHMESPHPFNTTPVHLKFTNNLKLNIIGDWGTGPWESNSPFSKVATQAAAFNADIAVHLGDVYYAGTFEQEQDSMPHWPKANAANFTLNSNHEMYNGANGYFAALKEYFPDQNNTSYFCLENDYWLIIGLDSAYASDKWNLYMEGNLNKEQIDWLGSLPKGKKIMVLSHHQAYNITGETQLELYSQVSKALGAEPDYWYWGHLHNGICYKPKGSFYGRCAGHGAVPYGNASELASADQVIWYETQLADDPNYPNRVLNGFVQITLKDETLAERFVGEDGSTRWQSEHWDEEG